MNQERGNQDDNTRERMSLRSDPFQDSVSTQPTHKPTEPHDNARRPRKVSMVSMRSSSPNTSLTMILFMVLNFRDPNFSYIYINMSLHRVHSFLISLLSDFDEPRIILTIWNHIKRLSEFVIIFY